MRRRKLKKIKQISIAVIILILFGFFFLYLPYKNIKAKASEVVNAAKLVKDSFKDNDIDKLKSNLGVLQNKYQLLQKNITRINIRSGDFYQNLKLSNDNYYDLIYVSNMFDNKKYCEDISSYLRIIKEKITKDGLLFVTTQNNPKKMLKLAERFGFKLGNKELHRFNIVTSLFGNYNHSFLLFKNI